MQHKQRNYVSSESDEWINVLHQIHLDSKAHTKRTHPPRYVESLRQDLLGSPIDNHSAGHSIRQIHNFYGWMAKEDARRNSKRGHCAGALYRTKGFMGICKSARDGSKRDTRNIHIEHTVPVRVLETILRYISKGSGKLKAMPSADLHRYLMQHSICVAFSHDEEQLLRSANVAAAWNEAFDTDGMKIHNHPFRRYLPLRYHMKNLGQEFKVFNVVTGEEVCLETFTFSDHERTLIAASKKAINSVDRSLYDLEIFNKSSAEDRTLLVDKP